MKVIQICIIRYASTKLAIISIWLVFDAGGQRYYFKNIFGEKLEKKWRFVLKMQQFMQKI
jgi:hypothetical protein